MSYLSTWIKVDVLLCNFVSCSVSINSLCKWTSYIFLVLEMLCCMKVQKQQRDHYYWAYCWLSRHIVHYLDEIDTIMHCRSHGSCHLSASFLLFSLTSLLTFIFLSSVSFLLPFIWGNVSVRSSCFHCLLSLVLFFRPTSCGFYFCFCFSACPWKWPKEQKIVSLMEGNCI